MQNALEKQKSDEWIKPELEELFCDDTNGGTSPNAAEETGNGVEAFGS